jgi:hypothetical protein
VTGFSLCVIGNSHAAAVWQAWKSGTIAAREGFSMTVFASQASSVEMDHRDCSLIPVNPTVRKMFDLTSGGKDRIEIDKYDAFLLVGLGWGIDLARTFLRCNAFEHLAHGTSDIVVSHGCMVEIIKAHNAKSPALAFAKQIRADSAAPILIYPTPFRPETLLLEQSDPCLRDRVLLDNIMPRSIAAVSELASEHGCEVFWQHPETVALPGLTKAKFAEGAVNLRESLENSSKHVNPDFAALSLQAILQRLGQAAQGSVPDQVNSHHTGPEDRAFVQPAA